MANVSSQSMAIKLLTYTIALTFIWFGALKAVDMSPVKDLVLNSVPPFIAQLPAFFLLLGIAEIILGIGLLLPKFARISALLLIIHLAIASISVIVYNGFSPAFPILTLEGEFVIKNLVLVAGCYLLFTQKTK